MKAIFEPKFYEVIAGSLATVALYVIPILDAVGTLMIISGFGASYFILLPITIMSLKTIAKVSRTNVKRHINNIKARSLVVLKALPELVGGQNMYGWFVLILAIICVLNALLFSAFRFQSYYYGCYIYLHQFGLGKAASQILTVMSYIAVLPASLFSVFSHLSDVYSSCNRLNDLIEWMKMGMLEKAYSKHHFVCLLASLVMLVLSFDFAVISYQSMLYKHVNYLAICPNTIFKRLKVMLHLLFPALVVIEVLRGLNFVRAMVDLVYDWENKDFKRVDLGFCCAAFFMSALSAYNYSRINYSLKSLVIALPMFTNNIINNVKWDKLGNNSDLYDYARKADIARFKMLINSDEIEKMDSLDALDSNNTTLLHYAAKQGCCQIVELLLKKGASTEKTDSRGNTPILTAVHAGKVDTVKLLLEWHANINAKNDLGLSALHCAVLSRNTDMVFYILGELKKTNYSNNNKDAVRDAVMRKDENNKNAITYAVLYDNVEIFSLLVKHCEQLNFKSLSKLSADFKAEKVHSALEVMSRKTPATSSAHRRPFIRSHSLSSVKG